MSYPQKIPLSQQVAAVQRAATNLRGHVENLRALALLRKRSDQEVALAEGWLPSLEEAALTMVWVQENEAEIRAWVAERLKAKGEVP